MQTNEHTNKRTNQQTWQIAIPPDRGNKKIKERPEDRSSSNSSSTLAAAAAVCLWVIVLISVLLVRVLLQQKDGIMAILAAVLHISDIKFETDPQTEGVFVSNDDILVLG